MTKYVACDACTDFCGFELEDSIHTLNDAEGWTFALPVSKPLMNNYDESCAQDVSGRVDLCPEHSELYFKLDIGAGGMPRWTLKSAQNGIEKLREEKKNEEPFDPMGWVWYELSNFGPQSWQ